MDAKTGGLRVRATSIPPNVQCHKCDIIQPYDHAVTGTNVMDGRQLTKNVPRSYSN